MARAKDIEEFKARRARQAVEAVQAMGEYRKAEGAALDRMARLRAERQARQSAAPLQAKTKRRKSKARLSHEADKAEPGRRPA